MESVIRGHTQTYEVMAILRNGDNKPRVAIVRMNHAYDVEENRFIQRMAWDGSTLNYRVDAESQQYLQKPGEANKPPELLSPVNSVSAAEEDVGELVKQEIDKLFKEQTADWCT